MKNKLRNDIIFVISVVAFAVLVFFCFKLTMKNGKSAKVTVDGKTIYTLSLNEDAQKKVKTELGENTVSVKDGKVSVIFADCPDKICAKHRAISKSGETIVCLPHKLVVEISGEDGI